MRSHAAPCNPVRRCRASAVALSLPLCCALSARYARAQQPRAASVPDTSTVVVECRIGDAAAQVVEARFRGDTLLLPARSLLTLAGLDSAGATGERSLEAASTLLHADVSFDPGVLVVQFADSGTLPVSRRVARARMRALLRDRERSSVATGVPARVPLAPSALTLSYSAQRDGSIAIDALSRAFGGALEGALARHAGGSTHLNLGWTRVPKDAGAGARIRIGALDELAGAAGVLVTNAPLLRDDTLRILPMSTSATAGAEIELFEDDVLVAADSVPAATVARIHRALRYGTHVVRLVTHDASGREHESRWLEFAPDALLSRGAFRYAAAAGDCSHRSCAAVKGSVAYAPSDRVTLGATIMPAAHPAPRTPALRATLDARIGDASVLSVRHGSTGGPSAELRIERGAGRAFVFRSGSASGAPVSALLPVSATGDHRMSSASGSWMLPAHAVLDVTGVYTRGAGATGLTASVPMRVGVVQGGAGASREGSTTCVGWNVGALVQGAWLARRIASLRSALLRVRDDQRSSACGTSTRSMLLALPVGATAALELSATWDHARGPRRPLLALALRRRIWNILSAHAELTGSERSYVARSDVAGTVVLDALRRGISFGVDPAGATVDGVVYVDDNANGRRDVGEGVVPGAVVRSDDASAVSDARGVFVLTGLAADRLARLSVDSVSVEDAGVVPSAPAAVVLTARTVVRVDIALRRREQRVR